VNFEKEINKIKYQLRLVSSVLDYRKFPIETMVLDFDWGKEELNIMHDIFERYDKIIENKEDLSCFKYAGAFEQEFKKEFDMDYQKIKFIILALHYSHQWTRVTKIYAETNQCSEFDNVLYSK